MHHGYVLANQFVLLRSVFLCVLIFCGIMIILDLDSMLISTHAISQYITVAYILLHQGKH